MDVEAPVDAASRSRRAPGLTAVDDVIDGYWARRPAPGLAYGVVKDGELVHWGGRGGLAVDGPAPTPDSVFRIASMTKSFTAAALLTLRDEGVLRLDDPVERYEPRLAGLRGPTADSPALTIRHLLTMSAGLPTDDPWGDRQLSMTPEAFDELLVAGPGFARAPGVAYEYSNLGYAILGRVVSAASREDYRQAVGSRVLLPLGMTSTTFDARDVSAADVASGYRRLEDGWVEEPLAAYGEFGAMGGLFSTLRDLATWVGEFTDAWPPRDDDESSAKHILRRATRREMQEIQRVVPPASWAACADGRAVPVFSGYGFGLKIDHDPRLGRVVGHPGGLPGFGSGMCWHPESGTGVVVLVNSTYAEASEVAAIALEALLPTSTTTPGPAHRLVPLPDTLAAQRTVVGLLDEWSDEVAQRVFSPNVDADESLARRAAAIARARERIGPWEIDTGAETECLSPARLAWWMRGERGRMRVEIKLDPRPRRGVQTLDLTVVPRPSQPLRAAAEAVAQAIERPSGPLPPTTIAGHDEERRGRALATAVALAGGCDLDRPIAGDGVSTASYALMTASGGVSLTVTIDPRSGALTDVSLTPRRAHDAAEDPHT